MQLGINKLADAVGVTLGPKGNPNQVQFGALISKDFHMMAKLATSESANLFICMQGGMWSWSSLMEFLR